MAAPSIAAQIKALQSMTVAQLRERWREVFGEQTTQRNRSYLWRRLAWKIQEGYYGSLPPDDQAKVDKYRRQFESTPPETWFPRGRGAKQKTATRPLRDPRLPSPGTILSRHYKGRQLNVKVLEKGFAYGGKMYRSLSAIATEVTGSRWNGFLFFGLTKGGGRE